MILQLQPTIPLDTEHGPADAFFLLDYSEQHPIYYIVFLRNTGECWMLDSRLVKLEKNITMGIRVNENEL